MKAGFTRTERAMKNENSVELKPAPKTNALINVLKVYSKVLALVFSFGFFHYSLVCAADVCWTLSDSTGAIVFTPSAETLPYTDHIEMSGEQMAVVLRWGVDERRRFTAERSLVFPMLRTIPNNTHASLMHRVGTDILRS